MMKRCSKCGKKVYDGEYVATSYTEQLCEQCFEEDE